MALVALLSLLFFGFGHAQNLTGSSEGSVADVGTSGLSLVAPKGLGILTVGVLGGTTQSRYFWRVI